MRPSRLPRRASKRVVLSGKNVMSGNFLCTHLKNRTVGWAMESTDMRQTQNMSTSVVAATCRLLVRILKCSSLATCLRRLTTSSSHLYEWTEYDGIMQNAYHWYDQSGHDFNNLSIRGRIQWPTNIPRWNNKHSGD
eukprot:m.347638 g.347638  ORF g.347638 m.347638 type:complete len:136 (+) comp20672_c0_seq5:2062-2469(+)